MAELPKITVPDNAKSAVIAPGSNGNSVTFRDTAGKAIGRPIILGSEGARFEISDAVSSAITFNVRGAKGNGAEQFHIHFENKSPNAVNVEGTNSAVHIHADRGIVALTEPAARATSRQTERTKGEAALIDPATGVAVKANLEGTPTQVRQAGRTFSQLQPNGVKKIEIEVVDKGFSVVQGDKEQSLVSHKKRATDTVAIPLASVSVDGILVVQRESNRAPAYTIIGNKSLDENVGNLEAEKERTKASIEESFKMQFPNAKTPKEKPGKRASLEADVEDRLRAAMAGIGELGETSAKITVPSEGSPSRNFHVAANPLDLDKSNSRT